MWKKTRSENDQKDLVLRTVCRNPKFRSLLLWKNRKDETEATFIAILN